jgi:hypothetical protein
VTHDQLAGLLSGLVGISVLAASYFRMFRIDYQGHPNLLRWTKALFALLIIVQAVALVALFA